MPTIPRAPSISSSSSRDAGSAQSRVLPALLLLTLALSLTACQRPILKPTVDPIQWSFGPTSPVRDDIPDPDDLLPLEPGEDHFIDIASKGAGDLQVPGAPAPAPGSPAPTSPTLLLMRVERVDADEKFPFRRYTPDRRIEHLGYDSKGALVLGAVEELDHQALSTYDPPIPVIPHNLKPGKPRAFTCRITVVNRTNPSQQMDKGTCELTITADAMQLISAPAGHFNCLRITHDLTVKLGLATVTAHTQSWYAEDVGLIAEKADETIKALFLSFNNRHTYLLYDTAPTPPRP